VSSLRVATARVRELKLDKVGVYERELYIGKKCLLIDMVDGESVEVSLLVIVGDFSLL
jgi:hypothetical protein